jgi:hypothetical protein
MIHHSDTESGTRSRVSTILCPTTPITTTPGLLKNGNLERHLRSLVDFSDHHWRYAPQSRLLDFPSVLRKGKVKLPDEGNQERMQLGDAIKHWISWFTSIQSLTAAL